MPRQPHASISRSAASTVYRRAQSLEVETKKLGDGLKVVFTSTL
jgi:hypothetical protein